ncbi:hypothetical protein HYX03_00680 [Candidatus Woesearchaeota archaeon]|nr:hypothetical protein [Candidatus Woesearchaeota archaeon]
MRHDRGERGFRPRNFAPVKVGDELDVKIEAVGEKGDGIAKKDGFVLVGAKSGQEESGSEESQESYEASEEAKSPESEEEYSGQDTEDFGEEGTE